VRHYAEDDLNALIFKDRTVKKEFWWND